MLVWRDGCVKGGGGCDVGCEFDARSEARVGWQYDGGIETLTFEINKTETYVFDVVTFRLLDKNWDSVSRV